MVWEVGVKANILATLTSKILSTMVSNNIPMEECIETIVQTLPVCKERGVAYSTFSVIHINNDGIGYMFEFDNPKCIFFTNGEPKELERKELNILNKRIFKTDLKLEDQDIIFLMSDGVPHARDWKNIKLRLAKRRYYRVFKGKYKARNVREMCCKFTCNFKPSFIYGRTW